METGATAAPWTSAIAPWAPILAQERLRSLENAHDERASADAARRLRARVTTDIWGRAGDAPQPRDRSLL
jgi:hypothetical protein